MHTYHVEYAASIKAVGTTTACIQCSSPRQHLTKCSRYGGQMITAIEQMSFYGACHHKNQYFYGTDGNIIRRNVYGFKINHNRLRQQHGKTEQWTGTFKTDSYFIS